MRPFNTITARELREQLESLDDDALVAFSCNYGDYSRTEQVLGFGEEPEQLIIEESAYSQSGWAKAYQDRDEDPLEEMTDEELAADRKQRVWVIRHGGRD